MKFGKTLRESIYAPWKDEYIDYNKLKSLLREAKRADDDDEQWTEDDEQRFCDEMFNVQLEKVTRFQEAKFTSLWDRINAAFDTLRDLAPKDSERQAASAEQKEKMQKLKEELDVITEEIRELKSFTRINYTGFQKIVKKHDRKRGNRYKVRPMMQVTMSNRPFTTEPAYSPLLKKLSIMYFIIRQHLEDDGSGNAPVEPVDLEEEGEVLNGERYTAHKFWVHPDNLLEVKTYILPRLPTLVYSSQSSQETKPSEDPTITSLYLDNPKFELYTAKVDRNSTASSVRIRWHGQLNSRPNLTLERKTVDESGGSSELRMPIKDKYVLPFLNGKYKMDKTVAKMERQGRPAEAIESLKNTADQLDEFIQKHGIAPVMRANYVRTAYQKPGDDRIRISIDDNVAFIREDTLDSHRPCRDRNEWHRTDIDDNGMTYPFKNIREGEVSKFPYAILEIKLKEDGRKRPAWVEDLMTSHLVHAAPRFSKFVHGVACLFDDYVNIMPFWMSDLDADIRKDPRKAFEEEAQRQAERAKDDQVVGSYLGTKVNSYRASRSSPVGQSYLSGGLGVGSAGAKSPSARGEEQQAEEGAGAESNEGAEVHNANYGTMSSILPSFSLRRYALSRRGGDDALPEGVVQPREWIKNRGDLKIEPKVWLANERTFLKWQHISILLGSLAVALFTAAGEGSAGRSMGLFYIAVAAFANWWGHRMLQVRRVMIVERSGKHFDNMVGPMVVSGALVVGIIVNVVLQWKSILRGTGTGVLATEL
ncbi:related to VTC2 - putative polyphosphate synthetase [Cephalotrichum gorgonifer]|uniref:Related to VTC2 - putative polyphosphate synthetase n=1 Tax=Cephalotrichum gorgonifer TaxID=2041049 RepID=A0AAE8MZU2_9PEZI|nr:related to VTC2 - putative polyphosphate synthetase [Cephalotrichum gorgonifer]